MEFFLGIKYNLKGVFLALKTPSLLILGLIRFLVILLLTMTLSGIILFQHDQILSILWEMPAESRYLLYLWHITSWLLSLFLAGFAIVFSYLIAQILFCVFIMDYMSRITERIILGYEEKTIQRVSVFKTFIYLIKQEIPRTIIPIIVSVMFIIIEFFTPLSPLILFFSSIAAAMFMAWDNTDLMPARRMIPFMNRWNFFKQHLLFHIGFGLLFLIPWFNILFLSFAPIGGTLFMIENK